MITQMLRAAQARIAPRLFTTAGALLVALVGALYLTDQTPAPVVAKVAGPAPQPAATAPVAETAPQPPPVVPPPPTDIELAQAAMSRADAGSAVLYLFRDLDREPTGEEALPMLVKCVDLICNKDCENGEHIRAINLLSQLWDRYATARQARMGGGGPAASLDDLETIDGQLRGIGEKITASADEQAEPHILAAERHANNAHYHWYTCWPNDRDEVREGLRELRWVQEHGAALSADMEGQYQQAWDRLKALVADSEWQPLLTEAGFAPKENSQ